MKSASSARVERTTLRSDFIPLNVSAQYTQSQSSGIGSTRPRIGPYRQAAVRSLTGHGWPSECLSLPLSPKLGHEAASCIPPHFEHEQVAADITESTQEEAEAIESTELVEAAVSTELASEAGAFLHARSRALNSLRSARDQLRERRSNPSRNMSPRPGMVRERTESSHRSTLAALPLAEDTRGSVAMDPGSAGAMPANGRRQDGLSTGPVPVSPCGGR